tara:strand:+ start:709 stop:1125 length:417 start_codon:yes stop_codon:yes gene_type:complete
MNIMYKLALKLIGLFVFISIVACSRYIHVIADRSWDTCTTTKKGLDSSCSYFITYTFNSDGTFTESHKSRDLSKIQSNYRNFWKLKDDILTITLTGENEEIIKSTDHKTKWLDSSTFYIIEKNAVSGVELYIYFQSVD